MHVARIPNLSVEDAASSVFPLVVNLIISDFLLRAARHVHFHFEAMCPHMPTFDFTTLLSAFGVRPSVAKQPL
jgi:hypothetical protein